MIYGILKYKNGARNIFNELLFEFVERPISELKLENDLHFRRDNTWLKKVNSSVVQLNDTKLFRLQYRVLVQNVYYTRCTLLTIICAFLR